MEAVADAVIAAVRQMDGEATTVRNGSPTGLCWYGGHFRPECKRPPTETSWTRRLEQILTQAGFPTRREVPYPHNRRQRCDNVIAVPGGGILWLENKGAWKEYWIQRKGEWIYRSYLLHPLVPGLDPKTHTVPLDLEKLQNLHAPVATHIGMLLLGFDDIGREMDGDVAQLESLAGLSASPWTRTAESWRDPYRSTGRVLAWLWIRPI